MPTSSTQLLSEIERQEQYLAELPPDYSFPLFDGRQAVESQRKSGYKTTARAAREIVDNAYEAGAKRVHVALERAFERHARLAKRERRNSVSAVAFIDDGPGMVPKMIRFALTWGGGTHFKEPSRIGKFGFGLPNSSINQTRRVEVYSRAAKADPWMMAFLDISKVPQHGLVTVDEAVQAAGLPAFVEAYLDRNRITLESGTVVVWDQPDRLTYRTDAQLREHLMDDFGVVYRDLLSEFELYVDSKRVEATDPLFLTPGARLYVPPPNGAERTHDKPYVLKFYRDRDTGAAHLDCISTPEEIAAAREDPTVEAIGTIRIKIARFPYGFAAAADAEGKTPDAVARFEVRKARRGMSFVRSGREIDTTDAFPRSARDKAAGLGKWPLLQSYAYHWGVAVYFTPELDEAFGIGNDKQTVHPIEEFWRVLSEQEIDRLLRQENAHQSESRKAHRRVAAERLAAEGAPSPGSEAAEQARRQLARTTVLPERTRETGRRLLREKAREHATQVAGRTPTDAEVEVAQKAIEEDARKRRYLVDFFAAEGGVFMRPGQGNGLQIAAEINKSHPFFGVFYSAVLQMGEERVRSALDVLLFALAEAELKAEDDVADWYRIQRENVWSPFLAAGLRILDRIVDRHEDEEELEGNEDNGSIE